ncbi:hypothetical protein KTO58_18250 [Chitinophaga pendula]|uniref:DUF5684 domain-containing protein n=1 Tax=Chitinophaga TaxID=79328 RepID=UPI000BAFB301|nr:MULTISPECIES: DUF5684 domain-containing protein [Chitinophaga]ASZ11377.1 hypothetical protein CK934_10565 [Chitinophaga sp. MD30]UCJ05619.1 hypothetical protein KTO58_18250 [Chitinophaga pendula]
MLATWLFFFVFVLVLMFVVCPWRIYTKAEQPGWASLVPVYATLVLLRIIGKPWWWLLLMLIPIVNIVFAIWATNLLSRSFGKSEGFTVGMLLLPFVFMPMLAFDRSVHYQGPAGDPDTAALRDQISAIGSEIN